MGEEEGGNGGGAKCEAVAVSEPSSCLAAAEWRREAGILPGIKI